MLSTTISLIPGPTSRQPTTMTSLTPNLQNALIVDLGFNQDNDEQQPPPLEAYSLCRERLRAVVVRDLADSGSPDYPHIDMVRIEGLSRYDRPSLSTWRALDGLRPRHLELHCGWDEICDMAPLDQLETSWPLESVVIATACGQELTSKYLYSITSLTLHFCCSMTFASSTEPSALRHLTIHENNALDMFIGMRTGSGIADNIQTLKLHSTNDCDFTQYEPADFFKTLEECSTLLSLDLALLLRCWGRPEDGSDYFNQLPHHFPPNLEHLRISGPSLRTIDDDLPAWFQFAVDPTWLPNLKSISFRLDLPHQMPAETESSVDLAQEFLAALAAKRPALSIIH